MGLMNGFNRLWKRENQRDYADQLFRGVLGREPSPVESFRIGSQLALHGDLEAIARDLVLSEEFSIQMLPQIVSKWTANYTGTKLFFLHVPKTAGTSVRLALSQAIGAPSLLLYRGFFQPGPEASFWPLWSGHSSINRFPDDRPGFTVFRDSRSRLLSWYRQRQKEGRGRQRIHLYDPHGGKTPQKVPDVGRLWALRRARLDAWYHFDRAGRTQGFQGWTADEVLDDMSKKEFVEGLKQGLSRISYAAWAHDADGLLRAVRAATGQRVESIPRENTLEDHTPHPETVQLTRRDVAQLEQVAEADQVVFEVARSLGLIGALDSDTADELFKRALVRHRFLLP